MAACENARRIHPILLKASSRPEPWATQGFARLHWPSASDVQTPIPSTHDTPLVSTLLSTTAPEPRGPRTRKRHQPSRERLPLLQLEEWDKDKTYNEDALECNHYHLGVNGTFNGKSVLKDTKTNLALAPAPYWRSILRPELEQIPQETLDQNCLAKAIETYMVVL